MSNQENTRLASRRAIEALRNGVPNQEAVRRLGCNQPQAIARFRKMMDNAVGCRNSPDQSRGMVISGDFGAGKSHLLGYLEDLALSRNFVCSRVAISKETPFYDLGKVFASAVENGRLPDRGGRFIEELAAALKGDPDACEDFLKWAEVAAADGLLSQIFAASLRVYDRTQESEVSYDVESFWAGDRIRVASVRGALKQIGESKKYRFRAPKVAELAPQRLRFAIELVKYAGYKGWIILLDEIELMGSYSILQRGRSYAEVARWMGLAEGEAYPGMIVVGAVTADFASAIISPDGQKKDRDYIRPKLEGSARFNEICGRAEVGMQMLEEGCFALESPNEADLNQTVEKLRRLYEDAYGWSPPVQNATVGGAGFQRRMRHKVRAAVNEWDLIRLRPGYGPDTKVDPYTKEYIDNSDLERESRDDDR